MKIKNIIGGLFFILCAVFIFAGQLGFVISISPFKLLLTIIMLCIMLSNLRQLQFFGIFLPLAILYSVWGSTLGIDLISKTAAFAIAVLLSIGLSQIIRPRRIFTRVQDNGFEDESDSSIVFTDKIETITENRIYKKVSFGTNTIYADSQYFEGADLHCSFGSMKAYFDGAYMLADEAIININVVCGDMEIYVPKDWNVKDEIVVSLGEAYNDLQRSGDSLYTVYITGRVTLGEVRINYI